MRIDWKPNKAFISPMFVLYQQEGNMVKKTKKAVKPVKKGKK